MPTLRIMSFNVRGSFVNDGANVWPARAALNVSTLKRHAPDLVGFQEIQTGNLETYARDWNGRRFERGPQYNNREPFCYPSVAWDPGKLTLASRDEFWVSETPEAYSASWETACIRSAQLLRFAFEAGAPPLVFLNTHLDHVSKAARLEGAKLIVRKLEALAKGAAAVVVTGDFNADPDGEPYAVFRDAGYRDAYRECGHADGPDVFTFHAFTGRRVAKPDHGRIDWILLRDGARSIEARSFEILRDAEPPLYPSDHYPVVAEVEV
ncbi:MAG: endonuclease/exonuclease/phosphatase family protein [Planctomycetota bacterium]|nr:endonuclease/exonuclease/phosphatase family protein [Planctomycetota bacterium]